MIPVSIVTGFLGSGKTTLISRLLRDPAFCRTAVIVAEFGEIALDHDLIASSNDSILTLSTGCLCCIAQSDLSRTLMELLARRETGELHYDRVLIETSGLSDPAPVLQSLMVERETAATHRVCRVVTVVDAVHGEATLRQYAEARHQVALADTVLVSKTDLQSPPSTLTDQLDSLNPAAPRQASAAATAALIFADADVNTMAERLQTVRRSTSHGSVETFAIWREHPVPAIALTLLLQAVAEHCGPRLLRMKGLVNLEEMPGRPALIHGVRHIIEPPEFLDRWPTEDVRTRIVFITTGVPQYFVSRLLDAIEAEVREEAALAGTGRGQ